jgi:Polysaccharide biosynthesis C-terminal domain
MNLLLICVAPIATLFAVAAPNIVAFLYHRADFVNTIPVIQGLAPGLVFLYMNALFSSIIIATKGEKKIPIMAGIALVFNLGLNLLLIPRYQEVGSAIITSLTELLLLCISFAFVPRDLLPVGSLKVGGKVLIAALAMALAAFLLRTLSIFIIGPVALLAYGSIATLLRIVPREDMQTLYRAFRHRGDRISTDALENVVDENIYMQITGEIPTVKIRKVQPEGGVEPETIPEENDITDRLPTVKKRRVQSEVNAQMEGMQE